MELTMSDFKGNMHHRYDISTKYAFHIIDLAAGSFFFLPDEMVN